MRTVNQGENGSRPNIESELPALNATAKRQDKTSPIEHDKGLT